MKSLLSRLSGKNYRLSDEFPRPLAPTDRSENMASSELLALEPRMLFDGAALATIDLDHSADANASQKAFDSEKFASADRAPADVARAEPRTLLVIDSTVKNIDALTQGLGGNVDVMVIDAGQDAFGRLASQLNASASTYSSIHILSHGQDGQIQLGGQDITLDTLAASGDSLRSIGEHLTQDGDLLLYGCDLAKGQSGQDFLTRLSLATNADVAASNNTTGGTSSGGDWVLEVSVGSIEASLPLAASAAESYDGKLAGIPSVSVSTGASNTVLLGETFSISATFDNTSPTDTGYVPYIDMFVPARGADGAANGTGADGITVGAGTYLGTPLTRTEITLTAADISAGNVSHPLFRSSAGSDKVSIPGGFVAGDKLVVYQLPFGSFAAGQPPATVAISATLSQDADLSALNIITRSGFALGNDALDNPSSDPSIQGAAVTTTINPAIYRLRQTYVGPETETATGPNYVRAMRIDIDVAGGQTINGLNLNALLPSGAQFVPITGTSGVVSSITDAGASPSGAWTNSNGLLVSRPVSSSSAPSTTVPGGTATANIASVVGTNSTTDLSMIVGFYLGKNDSSGNPLLDAVTADAPGNEDSQQTFSGSLVGTWRPSDARDSNTAITPSNGVVSAPITLNGEAITIQKTRVISSDVGVTGLSPGDTLAYTLAVQVSDYFAFGGNAAGQDLLVTDSLTDGLEIIDTTNGGTNLQLTVNRANGGGTTVVALIAGTDYTTTFNNVTGQQTMVFNLRSALARVGASDVLVGDLFGADTTRTNATTAQITFNARVLDEYRIGPVDDNGDSGAGPSQPSINEGDQVQNIAKVEGTVLNASLNPSAPGLQTDADDTRVQDRVAANAVTIALTGVNGTSTPGSNTVRPGDNASFCIEYLVPTGDYENMVLEGFLPLPLFQVQDPDLNGTSSASPLTFNSTFTDKPALGQYTFRALDANGNVISGAGAPVVLSHTTSLTGNSYSFNLGSRTDPANAPVRLQVCFTLQADDQPMADQLPLVVQAEKGANSTGNALIPSSSITPLSTGFPVLSIVKGAVGENVDETTSTFDSTFSPSDPRSLVRQALDGAANPLTAVITDANIGSLNTNMSGVDANDFVRFAIAVRNSGGSSAFDVLINDTLPAGFDPATATNLRITRGDGFTLAATNAAGTGAATIADLLGAGVRLTRL